MRATWVVLIIIFMGLVGCTGKTGSPVQPYRHKSVRTLLAPFDLMTYFHPTGFMGDGEHGERHVQIDIRLPGRSDAGTSAGSTVRVNYDPRPEGWAGIYWQYPDGNWGQFPGVQIRKATKIVFWARGNEGGEMVEFKAGGIADPKEPYRDSFEKSAGLIHLTTTWKRFEIDISREDTSQVIGGFAWITSYDQNHERIVFYLDDIRYE